ncbi:Proline-rich protein PRCC [Halotydeus destructor]|nr:Proline-rich protein PRCC [Halotydeus destructor]
MPLVAYEASDDSSDEEANPVLVNSDSKITGHPKTLHEPTPKPASSLTSRKVAGSSKVLITLPSLAELEDSSDDDEPKPKRTCVKSSSGSGLSSILPSPKFLASHTGEATGIVRTTVTQLIPDSIRRPRPETVKKPPPKTIIEEEDDGDFFSLNPSAREESVNHSDQLQPRPQLNSAPSVPKAVPVQDSSYHTSGPVESTSFKNMQSNEVAFKKKVASKFGEETADQIEIVDINVNDHISQNRDYLKTVSLEKPQEVAGDAPNPTAKRKHQITYLAHQAKQRELALKNEWAASKAAKNQTRAKYGF